MILVGHLLKLLDSPKPKTDYSLFPKIIFDASEEIFLPEVINIPTCDFINVLTQRQSRRSFSSPLNNIQISTLLHYTLKIKKIECDINGNIIWNHSNVPSAGGLASIDTFVVSKYKGSKQLFFYNPYRHSLNLLNIKNEDVDTIIQLANQVIEAQNSTLFIFAAQAETIFSKYQNAESLIWRDSGVIYMGLGLMAEALGLNSCALGITFEPILSEILGLHGVGGMLIGNS